MSANIRVVNDTVDGEVKPVVALVAHNRDGPWCGSQAGLGGPPCHKVVTSAGMIITANWYASGQYEVRGKAVRWPPLPQRVVCGSGVAG